MELEEVGILKQSEKSTVLLVHDKDDGQLYVQKTLQGRHVIYDMLQSCSHLYLPKVYEVVVTDDTTSVLEEYIDGQSIGKTALSEKQLRGAIKELCVVLRFLHEKGIIHRDIKPSNIMLASDGHIRLIDFDAARMVKDDAEQDTRLLGTRGYAPPEQYGFAQTDIRSDIYSLGITFKQLMDKKANKLRYRRIINKCTALNPEKRYQSVNQVLRAHTHYWNNSKYLIIAITVVFILCVVLYCQPQMEKKQLLLNQPQLQEQIEAVSEHTQLPKTDVYDLSPSSPEEYNRIVLTDIMKAPYNTINSSPVQPIGGKWMIDEFLLLDVAELYIDNRSVAQVSLFNDGSRIGNRIFETWSSPAYASSYISVTDYLELDMSKDEVLTAVEEAIQRSIEPCPLRTYLYQETYYATGELYDVLRIYYDNYDITYFFRPSSTLVEVFTYLTPGTPKTTEDLPKGIQDLIKP